MFLLLRRDLDQFNTAGKPAGYTGIARLYRLRATDSRPQVG
jgi:hypothetical protein